MSSIGQPKRKEAAPSASNVESSSTAKSEAAPAYNQNPKDDPASCVDPKLAGMDDMPKRDWIDAQQRELDKHLATTSACYRQAVQRNPALSGKLRLVFNYDKGRPSAKVYVADSSIDDCELATCIKRIAARVPAHLSPPDAGFSYVLEFKAGSAPVRADSSAAFEGNYCQEQVTQVAGRLPPAMIQRVVRENYEKFRYCYEKGLARDPTLAGRIAVRFVIERDGSVSRAGVAGNDMPDCDVSSCLVRIYKTLRFPKPDGGIVTVVYPIMFAPG
jgi:hypothetical protein